MSVPPSACSGATGGPGSRSAPARARWSSAASSAGTSRRSRCRPGRAARAAAPTGSRPAWPSPAWSCPPYRRRRPSSPSVSMTSSSATRPWSLMRAHARAHRQRVVERRADVVALTEARVAADRQQAAAQVAHVRAQRRLLGLGQALRRDVGQHDRRSSCPGRRAGRAGRATARGLEAHAGARQGRGDDRALARPLLDDQHAAAAPALRRPSGPRCSALSVSWSASRVARTSSSPALGCLRAERQVGAARR